MEIQKEKHKILHVTSQEPIFYEGTYMLEVEGLFPIAPQLNESYKHHIINNFLLFSNWGLEILKEKHKSYM